MIKATLDYLFKLKRNEIIAVGDKNFVLPEYDEVSTIEPMATTLTISTLTGLVEYVKDGIDSDLIPKGSFLHVRNYKTVDFVSPLFGINKQREDFVVASYAFGGNENFSHFSGTEDFIININSMFQHTHDYAYLMKTVSGLSSSASKELKDTGMAQAVTVKSGITTVSEMEVKNPIVLQPFKTFAEIDQPEISYVFRMKADRNEGAPLCALFECDGGLWKLNTIHAIKKWLEEKLVGESIKIIA